MAQGSTKQLTIIPTPPVPAPAITVNNLWLMSNLQNDKYRENKKIFICYESSNNSLQKMMMFRKITSLFDKISYNLVIGLFGGDSTNSDTVDSNSNNTAANDETGN